MQHNEVWELMDLPEGFKPIDCKGEFKTKKDSKKKIDRYKTRLVVKGLAHQESIDCTITFSPISSKKSFQLPLVVILTYNYIKWM